MSIPAAITMSKSSKQLLRTGNTPINPLHSPSHLNPRKEPIHTPLDLLRVPRHRSMDISESQTQFLARVESRWEACCVRL